MPCEMKHPTNEHLRQLEVASSYKIGESTPLIGNERRRELNLYGGVRAVEMKKPSAV